MAIVYLPKLLFSFEKHLLHVRHANIHFTTLRTIRLVFIILNVVHWIGCIWYYLGFTLGIDPTVTSWTKIPSMMDTAENLATGMTQLSRKYIRSVYFAVVSITTVGYGDIACSNVPETIFNIFVVLVSSGLFSALAGSMEMRLQVLERHTTDYRRMVALFNQ